MRPSLPFPLATIILAAGKGTRMKSNLPKVLHPMMGKPLVWYPISRALELHSEHIGVVIGHHGEQVEASLRTLFPQAPLLFCVQQHQHGTGDAINAARTAFKDFKGAILILSGDVPLLTSDTLARLCAAYRDNLANGKLALVSSQMKNAKGYGRLVRQNGKVVQVIEEKDATDEQRKIKEANMGVYLAEAAFLWKALENLSPKNAAGELYLTDIIQKAAILGTIATVEGTEEETAGINDRTELALRAAVARNRINEHHMKNGVTIEDPNSTFIEEGVSIGMDTVLGPQVSIGFGCVIGSNVRIGKGSVLTHSKVGDGVEIKPYSVLEQASVADGCIVGPFARLRPGTVLDEGVHIGNFVETKNTKMKKGSKANHLSYLGDAEVGSASNIGAGTITCNYDGVNKMKTVLGDNVFVGSDTQLVAPVTVGNGVFIAAGTTVTEDVPADALVLSRTRQTVKPGWAEQRRKLLRVTK